MKDLILAVDFDGTIVDHEYPYVGRLKPWAGEVLRKLSVRHYIIIWTCRYTEKDLAEMKDFLKKNKIPYDRINENAPELHFQPTPKIYADYYIDDRNLGTVINWALIAKKLLNKEEFEKLVSEVLDFNE